MTPWRWLRTRFIGGFKPIRRPEFSDTLAERRLAARAELVDLGLALDQGSSLEQRRAVMRGDVVSIRRGAA